MRLKVEGFGPISYADVEMKPLTVLIGRNNAGKSMLAQLAFTLAALTEAPTPMQVLEPTLQYRRMRVAIEPHFISFVVHEYLRERLKKSREVTRQSYAKMVVDAMVDRLTALLNEALKGALEGNFAVALKKPSKHLFQLCQGRMHIL
jgi:hypothetical protein